MNMDRINQLQQFVSEEPQDPFNFYALALEYLKSEPQKAVDLFEDLLRNHSDYLPTYYPYAQLLIERKDYESAEKVFQKGIEIAQLKGEIKTQHEIQSAYNDWKYEMG